jgi:glutathione S-transferase
MEKDRIEHMSLLAVAIGEWTATLKHLRILTDLGVEMRGGLIPRVEREQRAWCQQWQHAIGIVTFSNEDIPAIVAEARVFATIHQSELDDLTTEKEVSNDESTTEAGAE